MSAATICLVAAFTGTARPSPTPATAVLIPTTEPRVSASAPPEFPGLSAASVWITFSISRAAAHATGDAQVRDRRRQTLRDEHNGARVGVQRLLAVQRRIGDERVPDPVT